MVGNLPDRDMAMLEERIKRTSKSRPPPSSNGPPAAAQPPPEPIAPPEVPSRPNSGLPRPGMNRNIPTSAGSGGLAAMRRNFQQQQQQQEPQQPRQFAPKNSPGRDRPISGAFTLDPEITEPSSMNGSIGKS